MSMLENEKKKFFDKVLDAFDGKTLFILAFFCLLIYYGFGYFKGRLSYCENQQTEERIAYQVKIAELIVDRDRRVDSANANTILEVKNCQNSLIELIREVNAMRKKIKDDK